VATFEHAGEGSGHSATTFQGEDGGGASRAPESSPCVARSAPARGRASPSVAADAEGSGLIGVAAKASHFEVAVTSIERIAQPRRCLRRALVRMDHARR
jgi:hypothetical protein